MLFSEDWIFCRHWVIQGKCELVVNNAKVGEHGIRQTTGEVVFLKAQSGLLFRVLALLFPSALLLHLVTYARLRKGKQDGGCLPQGRRPIATHPVPELMQVAHGKSQVVTHEHNLVRFGALEGVGFLSVLVNVIDLVIFPTACI